MYCVEEVILCATLAYERLDLGHLGRSDGIARDSVTKIVSSNLQDLLHGRWASGCPESLPGRVVWYRKMSCGSVEDQEPNL
jgi:hypothetical protein